MAGPKTGFADSVIRNCDWWHGQRLMLICESYCDAGQPRCCSSLYVPEPEVQVLDVEGPVTHPTWATGQKALLGFVEVGGRRLVLVDPETGETLRSRAVEGTGENFGLIA